MYNDHYTVKRKDPFPELKVIERISINTAGRDFAIGDPHARFRRMDALLDYVGFDRTKDRLFILGDLVDRGEEPRSVLEWLKRPYVYAILGNHEIRTLEYWYGVTAMKKDGTLKDRATADGCAWLKCLTDEERDQFIEAFIKLPYLIQVEGPNGQRVGLSHSSGYSTWSSAIEGIATKSPEGIKNVISSHRRFRHHDDTPVGGITRVFCGHIRTPEVRRFGNVYHIDTGSVDGGHPTLINIHKPHEQYSFNGKDSPV